MRLVMTIIIALSMVNLFAANPAIDSQIESVTVFLSKAEIHRKSSTYLPLGNHEVVIRGLSSRVDQNTIQVKGFGDFTILSTRFRKNYLDQQALPIELQQLKDSIGMYELQMNGQKNLVTALKQEEDLLKSNKMISGRDESVTVSQLKLMAEYYRKRILAIQNEIFEVTLELKKQEEVLKRLKKQFQERSNSVDQQLGEIVLEVAANSNTNATFTFSYVVAGAGWNTEYNIRSNGVSETLELEQYALVHQSTGENWDNVALTLSTQNPSVSSQKPALYPWYLNIIEQQFRKAMAQGMAMDAMSMVMEDKENNFYAGEAADVARFVEVVEQTLSVAYKISLPYTIKNGSKSKRVAISNYEVKAKYQHYAIPKLSDKVYLVANTTDWSGLNLLPGTMNIFLDGAFVGKSFIDPVRAKDELPISLGIDQSVWVERKPIKDFTSDQFIGNKRRRKYGYELVVQNNKAKTVQVKLMDQVPVSKNSDIDVQILDISGGTRSNEGYITWEFALGSRERQNRQLQFEVKYPKEKRISGL